MPRLHHQLSKQSSCFFIGISYWMFFVILCHACWFKKVASSSGFQRQDDTLHVSCEILEARAAAILSRCVMLCPMKPRVFINVSSSFHIWTYPYLSQTFGVSYSFIKVQKWPAYPRYLGLLPQVLRELEAPLQPAAPQPPDWRCSERGKQPKDRL